MILLSYLKKLYDEIELSGHKLEQEQEVDVEMIYPILRGKFDKVLKDLKIKKDAGICEIPAGLWKTGEQIHDKFLNSLKIYICIIQEILI